ncbi:tryptophan synthase subunit alpha [Asticcacaulis sp. AC402]|uniref:tryptophan synthase subunit alpha n=1 Tax=Asticcacaulis sp. AC402 TaxID=1282361 RepID=UPI0003C3BAE2|nr:tryptophan synthase subunit alpha [Asticcacaulis sp. AC402]ESQ75814.1 tryptophan synthase subunit alpha [Asticcacaulis sp. AC402]
MTVSRIDAVFAGLKAKNQAAFIAYIMAGDPDLDTTFEILKGLPAAGADLIELGFPFSDPMAEGPTIQHAAERSLKAGTKIRDVFELVRRFREVDETTPLILMGYMNPVEFLGYEAWAAKMAQVGADGMIVVDCPPEEADGLADALDAQDVALIRLVTPTSDTERLKTLVKRTRGFVYYVSVTGVTGVKAVDASAIAGEVRKVQDAAQLPVAVGFGIRSPEQAAAVARISDAAVVGSALVDEIKLALSRSEALEHTNALSGSEALEATKKLPESHVAKAKVLEKVAILAQAVHSAR